eukprot:473057-Rhodomonas_salina.1
MKHHYHDFHSRPSPFNLNLNFEYTETNLHLPVTEFADFTEVKFEPTGSMCSGSAHSGPSLSLSVEVLSLRTRMPDSDNGMLSALYSKWAMSRSRVHRAAYGEEMCEEGTQPSGCWCSGEVGPGSSGIHSKSVPG